MPDDARRCLWHLAGVFAFGSCVLLIGLSLLGSEPWRPLTDALADLADLIDPPH